MAVMVKSKTPDEIIQKFTRVWVGYFGAPSHAIMSDNGGEFNNHLMVKLAELYNVKLITTAAYAPYSNGVCERHNQVITEMLTKVTAEFPYFDMDTRLMYVCMAKNNLNNNWGFTPSRIMGVGGKVFPGVLSDRPPALNVPAVEDVVTKNLSLFHRTRELFVKAENSDRIRRALRHNVRSSEVVFEMGDSVFYRSPNDKRWRGPGKVIGADGKVVFVRHGGQCIKAHQSDLLTAHEEDFQESQPVETRRVDTSPIFTDTCSNIENPIVGTRKSRLKSWVNDKLLSDIQHVEVENSPENMLDSPEPCVDETNGLDIPDILTGASTDPIEQPDTALGLPVTSIQTGSGENVPSSVVQDEKRRDRPKVGSIIRFELDSPDESGAIYEAKVLSRAGKAKGKFCNWYNIEFLAPEERLGDTTSVDYVSD